MKLLLKSKSVFAFSDTHGHHRALQVPEDADIIIKLLYYLVYGLATELDLFASFF